jgi:hypothetical protein
MSFRSRLRALQARFHITPGLPVPNIVTEYVAPGPHDSQGTLLGPGPGPVSGCVDNSKGERILRNPGETVNKFTTRLLSLATKKGRVPPHVFLFPPDVPPVN